MRHIPLILSLMMFLTGCTVKSLGDNRDSNVILTDAKQRAITVIAVDTAADKKSGPSENKQGQAEQKNATIDGRRVIPHRIICAEPSPDIATAVSESLKASLEGEADVMGKGKGKLKGNFDRSVTESIAQLGSRLATIQLLRDELSDLCRAYANGAVSSITYTLRLSRLDKKMITLLVSEASAGALSRALVSINGLASNGGSVPAEQLAEAEARVKKSAEAMGLAGATLDAANKKKKEADEGAKDAAQKEVVKAEEELRAKLIEHTEAQIHKLVLETHGSGLVAASTATAIAGFPTQTASSLDLKGIHRAYLDDDDLGTLLDACLTSMEDNAIVSDPKNTGLEPLREKLRFIEIEREKKRSDLEAVEYISPTTDISRAKQIRDERNTIIRDLNTINLEIVQLNDQINELSGSQSRTGLLAFCRGPEGLRRITHLMERKMSDRYSTENRRNEIDMCKVALTTSTTDLPSKQLCVERLFGPRVYYPSPNPDGPIEQSIAP